MIRSFYLLTFLLMAALYSLGQSPLYSEQYADSLGTLLKETSSDSSKARIHFLLSNYWVVNDISKAKPYLDKGRELSGRNNYLQGIGYSCEGYYYFTSDITKSEEAYKKADTLLSKFKNKEAYVIRANSWYNRAVIRQRQDDDKAYIDILLNKSIPLALNTGDSTLVGAQYVGLGVAFMNLDQNEKAEIYLDKAIQILKRAQPFRLAAAYNRAGENYVLLKKWDKVKEVLQTNKAILAPYPNSDLYAGYYMIEGLYFHELKNFRQAIISFNKGISKANGQNKIYIIQELLFYKTKSLINASRYSEAKKILAELSNDQDVMEIDQSRLEVYDRLATVYKGLHKTDSAFYWLQQYSILNDSLHQSSFKNDINELEAKYEHAESQKKIALLQAEKAETALSASNNRLFNWLLGAACLVLLIIAFFSFTTYRYNKKLSAHKEINHQQQLKDIEQQQQITIASAMLEGEERERKRVARDLHDGLGGMLAGVKINLSGWAANNLPIPDKGELNRVIRQLDNSVGELRRIARNMMPETLLRFGLEAAVRDLCTFYANDHLHIEFQPFSIEKSIPLSTQVNIYRIIQEILSNAIRHAQATNIVLQCSQNGDIFFITIEDNGVGFNTSKIADKKGMGIHNIKNRAEYLKGKVEIISASGEGTSIYIQLSLDSVERYVALSKT